ncbi:hypothetical protein DKX38_000004 [Salix brachista]|uniref:Transcription factor Pur-alpha 1 n=1 Tax=Salix brachista TaxID=2182728 RepID=A0A5N5NZL2_9ROSI|nr:hypothetical protein DKX38_000004 [Salix brachista]
MCPYHAAHGHTIWKRVPKELQSPLFKFFDHYSINYIMTIVCKPRTLLSTYFLVGNACCAHTFQWAGFISGQGSQAPAPTSELNVDRSVELAPQDEISNLGVSKVIRVDQKRFFFDLGSNNRGHFLRISEVAGNDRSSIILPLSGLKQFHETVGHFVEITKDRIEGMTGANVRTIDPLQR